MKTRSILILVILSWLFVACQQSTPSFTAVESTAALQTDLEQEEYAVYSALLNDEFSNGDIKLVLIMDHTRVEELSILQDDLASFQKNSPLTADLLDSFMEKNQDSHLLEEKFEIKLEYSLLTQQEVDEFRPLDEASGWDLFYEKYPKSIGFIYLSEVGFNADATQALVAYSIYRYEQPLSGCYCFMIKQNGDWVLESGMEWIT